MFAAQGLNRVRQELCQEIHTYFSAKPGGLADALMGLTAKNKVRKFIQLHIPDAPVPHPPLLLAHIASRAGVEIGHKWS